MGKSKRISMLRGKRMRVTEVSAAGLPVYGEDTAIVTDGFVTVTATVNTEDGEAINVTNANGDSCIAEAAVPTVTGVSVEAEFCNVDFALFEKLTGQQIILDEFGNAIGIDEKTSIALSDIHFALEAWTGVQTSEGPSAGSQGQYGYFIYPNLTGGVLGDVTIENGALTFTVSNMNSKDGAAWGSGPYAVELVGGVPAVLRVPLSQRTYRRIMAVEVAPPKVFPGTIPVLDPTDAALTSITATATGLSVAFSPVPAGTDPVWYDFGDGLWDYAETGSYTHVYDVAGTYTVTAHRGVSTVTTTVTVS